MQLYRNFLSIFQLLNQLLRFPLNPLHLPDQPHNRLNRRLCARPSQEKEMRPPDGLRRHLRGSRVDQVEQFVPVMLFFLILPRRQVTMAKRLRHVRGQLQRQDHPPCGAVAEGMPHVEHGRRANRPDEGIASDVLIRGTCVAEGFPFVGDEA